MDNYLSLDAQFAHHYYTSGWVSIVKHMKIGDNTILKADVKPSYYLNDKPHHPWVVLSVNGKVITAHCDCMAGLAI